MPEAQDKFDGYRQYLNTDAALVHAAASLGVDLARFDLDEPVDTSATRPPAAPAPTAAAAAGPWPSSSLWQRAMQALLPGHRKAPGRPAPG